MNYFTFNLSEEQLLKLNTYYKPHLRSDDNPHLLFKAFSNNINISAYKSGSVVLQGEFLVDEIKSVKKFLNIVDYDAIGSDEVGTGDLFGPVVVCASYVKESDIPWLEELNIRDSKGVKTRELLKMANILLKRIEYSLVILTPKQYNNLVDKGFNLNKIKAFLHNHVLIKLTSKVNKDVPVIVDQFCLPKNYYNYLKDETLVYRDITFKTKAEKVHLSVSVSSIIARYAFLAKMREYSKKYNTKLKLGANAEVYDQLNNLVNEHGDSILTDLVKTNFKGVKELAKRS